MFSLLGESGSGSVTGGSGVCLGRVWGVISRIIKMLTDLVRSRLVGVGCSLVSGWLFFTRWFHVGFTLRARGGAEAPRSRTSLTAPKHDGSDDVHAEPLLG